MRIAPVLLVATGLLLAAPATATADVIFDPADADDLAAVLAEAYADQNVCYGWDVSVSDPVSGTSQSVGSNFGAGEPVRSSSCEATVTFRADITYTSESSEAEDSASYDVSSNPAGVTRADLDDLGIDFGGLTGEDPDVAIGQAVTALPLLAADAGIAKPISAAPATGQAPADAQLTDDPDSDWWRNQGGMVMWALIVMAAGGVFAWWVLRTERRRRARARRRGYPKKPTPPPYQPSGIVAGPIPEDPGQKADGGGTPTEPPTEELPAQEPPAPEPPTEELPVQATEAGEPAEERKPAAEAEEPAAQENVADEKGAEEQATEEPTPAKAAEEGVAGEPAAAEPPASEQQPAEAAEGQATEKKVVEGTAAEEPATEGQAAGSADAEPSAAEAQPVEGEATAPAEAESATPESTVDPSAGQEPGSHEQARPAPSDQKDKE